MMKEGWNEATAAYRPPLQLTTLSTLALFLALAASPSSTTADTLLTSAATSVSTTLETAVSKLYIESWASLSSLACICSTKDCCSPGLRSENLMFCLLSSSATLTWISFTSSLHCLVAVNVSFAALSQSGR